MGLPPDKAKTHCPHGHELSGDNLEPWHLKTRNARACWTCHKQRAYKSRLLQVAAIGRAAKALGLTQAAYIDRYGWSRHVALQYA